MAGRVQSTTPWLDPLLARRERLAPTDAPANAEPAASTDARAPLADGTGAPAPRIAQGGTSGLGALKLPDKLVAEHGAHLRGALADLGAIALASKRIAPHQVKPFALAEKKLYGVLEAELSRAPEAHRPAIARAFAHALRLVVDSASGGPELVPAMYAAIGLLDAGARLSAKGRLARSPNEVASGAEASGRAVVELLDHLRGRDGASSALHVFGHLVEGLAFAPRAAKLSEAEWRGTWREVTTFLDEAGHRRGFSPEIAAELAEHVDHALGQGGAVLARATETIRAAVAPEREAALAKLRAGDPLHEALRQVVARSPGGPSELFEIVGVLSDSAAGLDAVHLPLARVVQALAGAPRAAEGLAALAEMMPKIAQSPAAQAVLTRAGAGAVEERLASNLVRVRLALDGVDVRPFSEALAKLDALDAGVRLSAALATLPALAPARLALVVHHARTMRSEAPLAELSAVAARHVRASELVARHPRLEPEAGAIAGELARIASTSLPERHDSLLAALAEVKALLPGVPAASLLASKGGRPGLAELADPASGYRTSPLELLPELVAAAAPSLRGRTGRDTELARLAMEIAGSLGRLGRDVSRHRAAVVRDFAAAVAAPEKLARPISADTSVSVRMDKRSISLDDRLHAVPGLPVEAAATAAVHLSSEQLAWIRDRIASNPRDLAGARALRDFVFACVESGHVDLIEAARISPSAPRAVRSAIARVAEVFRAGELHSLPLDALVTGLRAGRDAVADVDRATDAGEIPGVDLAALTGGRVTAEGRAELRRAATNLGYYLSLYVPGGSTADADIDMASLRPVLLSCIESVASGTWPTPKYENAVGLRQMAELSADQQAVWRRTLVTPMTRAAEVESGAAIAEAMALLRGLHAAMPEHVELRAYEGIPLGWDQASIDHLRAVRDALVDELRAHTKGTPEHARLAKELGPVRADLAVLELWRALDQTVGAGLSDPRDVILRLRPALTSARGVLASRGGAGFAEAVDQILFATQELRASPREGRHAADEDSISALTTSNTSGCLSPHWPGGPGRQWGIAGALADANVRMLRVFDGDRQLYRGFMKFFHAELPGYSGPVLWLDSPVADGGGNDDDLRLWYRHGVHKATAMGVPLVVGKSSIAGNYHPERLAEVARELGLEVRDTVDVRFAVDEGNTGYMHSDTLFEGKGNIRAGRGDKPTWNFSKASMVVMPQKVGG